MNEQRSAVDALLRSAPNNDHAPVEQRRARYAETQSRPLPADVSAAEVTLGGRPALELVPSGIPDDDRPVLLYFFGGRYVVGTPRTGAVIAARLAQRLGARAFVPAYRLAPENPFPAAVDDALAAYRDLLDRGIAPAQISLAGDSAGGGLSLATLLAARSVGLPLPSSAAVFSPWVDLTLSGATIDTLAGVDPLFTRDRLRHDADRYAPWAAANAPLASPVFADLTGLPPLLVQVGANEILLDDAVRLVARAGAVGVDSTLEIWPGVPHVFQSFAGMLDDAERALDRAGQFLRRHLPAIANVAA